MSKTAILAKATAPSATPHINPVGGKSLPSAKPVQLAAEMFQQPSTMDSVPGPLSEKESSVALQLKSSAGIFGNNPSTERKSASTWPIN